MDLKNAVAVCLISLVSATLVVLIARTLDSQAASRLEPQLARIVEELQAIRKQGGIPTATANSAQGEAVDDGLVVYYFHSNTRCPTCESIESQAHETVQARFTSQLDRGEIVWKILNYEQPAASELAKKFDIQVPVVVLARMKGGQVQDWKRLDDVWALVGDKPAFAAYIGDEIRQMLDAEKKPPPAPSKENAAKPPAPPPPDLPVPSAPSDIPIPK